MSMAKHQKYIVDRVGGDILASQIARTIERRDVLKAGELPMTEEQRVRFDTHIAEFIQAMSLMAEAEANIMDMCDEFWTDKGE